MYTNNALAISNLPVAHDDGLPTYLRAIHDIPLLSLEEEQNLALRFREDGDLMAAERLVLAHLRYVVKVARGFNGYGLAFADLIQEGTIGLMKAVKRFDPALKIRLVTFALYWIKSEIHDFILRNWRIVKVATTKAQRKLFFNLRRAKNHLGWFSAEEINMVADDLGVKPKEVLEMEQRLYAHDVSFDASDDDDEEAFLAPAHCLTDVASDPASSHRVMHKGQQTDLEALQVALERLDERSQKIIQARWLSDEKHSLKALADEFQISIERVRQIESAAMKKMREFIPV
jgi:RNA polymerase sigma-32 factor